MSCTYFGNFFANNAHFRENFQKFQVLQFIFTKWPDFFILLNIFAFFKNLKVLFSYLSRTVFAKMRKQILRQCENEMIASTLRECLVQYRHSFHRSLFFTILNKKNIFCVVEIKKLRNQPRRSTHDEYVLYCKYVPQVLSVHHSD